MLSYAVYAATYATLVDVQLMDHLLCLISDVTTGAVVQDRYVYLSRTTAKLLKQLSKSIIFKIYNA